MHLRLADNVYLNIFDKYAIIYNNNKYNENKMFRFGGRGGGGGFFGRRGGSGFGGGFLSGLLLGGLGSGGYGGGYGGYPTYSGPGFSPTSVNPYPSGLLVTDGAGNQYIIPYGTSYPNWLLGSPAYSNFYGGRGGRMWNRWVI